MSILYPISICTFCLLLARMGNFSIAADRDFDIYEAIQKLTENMRLWKSDTLEKSENNVPDTTDLSAIFAGYNLNIDRFCPDTLILEAKLPLYMGILSTNLKYSVHYQNQEQTVEYISPLTQYNHQILYDDSALVKTDSGFVYSENLDALLYNSFYKYRTLNLPYPFRPQIQKEFRHIVLYIHGPDLDSLDYQSESQLFVTLCKLSKNMVTYSGPVRIDFSPDSLKVQFYVLITPGNVLRHHLLLINDWFLVQDDNFFPTATVIDFYPYINMENVLSICGIQKEENDIGRQKIEIEIR